MRKIKLADLEFWYDPAHCLKAVESEGYALRFVPEAARSEAVCLKAVERSGYALQYVADDRQTEAVCLEAVKQDGDALRYVPKAFWGLFKHMISGL